MATSEEDVQQLTLKVQGAAEVKRLSDELRNNERDILRVADAYIEGAITEKQYQAATAQLAAEYKLLAEQMEVAKLAVKGLTPEMVAAAQAAAQAAKATAEAERLAAQAAAEADRAAAEMKRLAAQGFAGIDTGGKTSEVAAARVRNLNQTMMAASYAFQDATSASGGFAQRLSSVQNNLPMILMGLGVGGPLVAGLSAISVGLGVVISNWSSLAGLFSSRNPIPEATGSLQAMESALKANHSALDALRKQTSLSNSELVEFNRLTKEGAELEARAAMMRDLERAKKEKGPEVAARRAEIEKVIKEAGGERVLKDVQDALVARYGSFGAEADKAMAEQLLMNAQAGQAAAMNTLRDLMAVGKAAQTETARLLEGRPKPAPPARPGEFEHPAIAQAREMANIAAARKRLEEEQAKAAKAEEERQKEIDEEFDATMDRLKRIRAKEQERARPLVAPYQQAEGARIEAEALAAQQAGRSPAEALARARERVAATVKQERGVSEAVAEEVARQVVHDVRQRMDAALIVEAGRRRAAAALPPPQAPPAPVAPPPAVAPAPVVAPVAMAAPEAPELVRVAAPAPEEEIPIEQGPGMFAGILPEEGPPPAPAEPPVFQRTALFPAPALEPPPQPAAPPPETPVEGLGRIPEAIAGAVGDAVGGAMDALGVRPGGRPLLLPAPAPPALPPPAASAPVLPPGPGPDPFAWVAAARERERQEAETRAAIAPPVAPGPAPPAVLPRGPEFGGPAPAEFPAVAPGPTPPPPPPPPARAGAPVIPPKPTPVEAEQVAEARRLAGLTPEQRATYQAPKPSPKQVAAAQMGRLTPEQQAAYWARVERERPPEMVGPPEPAPTPVGAPGGLPGPPAPVKPRAPGPVRTRIARARAGKAAKQARMAARQEARRAAAAERQRRARFGAPAPPTPEMRDAAIVKADQDRQQASQAKALQEARDREALARQVQRQTEEETGTRITPEQAREVAGKAQAMNKDLPGQIAELVQQGVDFNQATMIVLEKFQRAMQAAMQNMAIQARAMRQMGNGLDSMQERGATALNYPGH